ncbi:MAG TPA: RseA family anti-sigma factor [Xanthomonadaceae bacterium]|nr:RseA family anti-sigma factor [Xanthomonadaceae bacterium]
MTSPIDERADERADAHDADARLSLQQRRQLSALVDGDLAPDQAAFLLRRLGHDTELAGRWQRWHLIGDVLRKHPVATLPAGADGFPAQVAAALADAAPRQAIARRPRWPHFAALAASMTVVALFVARPPSADGELAGTASGTVATVGAPATSPAATRAMSPPASAATQPSVVEPVREVSVPQFAEVEPAPAAGREPRRQVAFEASQRAGTGMAVAADQAGAAPAAVLAASDTGAADAIAASAVRPFARPGEPQARPWPRATLPSLARPAGEFTVGFDEGHALPGSPASSATPSFYPFEPQLPTGQASPGAGDAAVAPERIP